MESVNVLNIFHLCFLRDPVQLQLLHNQVLMEQQQTDTEPTGATQSQPEASAWPARKQPEPQPQLQQGAGRARREPRTEARKGARHRKRPLLDVEEGQRGGERPSMRDKQPGRPEDRHQFSALLLLTLPPASGTENPEMEPRGILLVLEPSNRESE